MEKYKKIILILLLVLNAIVLLGQVWPAGAPPFARAVNIATLTLNLIVLVILIRKNKI